MKKTQIRDKKLATIHYYDIGDYLDRDEKLQILRDCKSIAGIEWEIITPNEKHDWINQRGEDFDSFIPMGDKKNPEEQTMFENYSRGLETARDAWCYNFSQKKLTSNMKRMIAFYNEQVEAYKEHKRYNGDKTVDQFIDNDPAKIAWSSSLKSHFQRSVEIHCKKNAMVNSMYRPFTREKVYFDGYMNHRVGQMPQIFPEPGMENMVIGVCGIGVTKDFSVLMSDAIIDLQMLANGQCFPFYTYEKSSQLSVASGQKTLLTDDQTLTTDNRPPTTATDNRQPATATGNRLLTTDNSHYIRRENISDAILKKFREHYGESGQLSVASSQRESGQLSVAGSQRKSGQLSVAGSQKLTTDNWPLATLSKKDIFYYVYGILHCPSYRERFSSDLKKQLPRIPFAADFWTFSNAGRELAALHLNYETGTEYPLREEWSGKESGQLSVSSGQRGSSQLPVAGSQTLTTDNWLLATPTDHSLYRVTKMRFSSKVDKSAIVYNSHLTLSGIPPEAYRFVVNGKSAIEWLIDRYQKTTHKDSGIENDPNDWCKEHDSPDYIVRLIKRVTHLSVESVMIIEGLPELEG